MNELKTTSFISEEEYALRCDLAACYQLFAMYGWTDLAGTHITVRLPNEEAFLINRLGLHFHEITASNLIKIGFNGDILTAGVTDKELNFAGYVIHSAVHQARDDAHAVMHTHTRAGIAVSCMECGLLPLNQHSLRFYNRLAYHDYEGVALDLDERARLVADLGKHDAMILRNHGLLALGPSIPDGFHMMYYLERSCEIQIAALAGGGKLIMPDAEICEKTARQYDDYANLGARDWAGLIRKLESMGSHYKD